MDVPFIGDFEVGPNGQANFDISSPSGSSPASFPNPGVELTPDFIDNEAKIDQGLLESFPDNPQSFCKYLLNKSLSYANIE